ncbi:hypothetical protein Tcan_14482 [Toxocara canis]|uniref:F-box domain-containing protein n=1 Tax=Toxocara canis TaxID=6265 RepID=A0A0B2VCG6_TOXCA|nr:hypothetical protein Tcan_14482 [Toxocara canis]
METGTHNRRTMKLRTVATMPIRLLRCLRSIRRIEAGVQPRNGISQGTRRTREMRQTLPDSLIFRVLLYALPLDLCIWRRVSKSFKKYVDERISNVIEIDVHKACIEDATTSATASLIGTAHSKYVDERISNVIEIDVHKACIEDATTSATASLIGTAHSKQVNGYGCWEWQRFHKAHVSIRLVPCAGSGSKERVELVVDERWRSADVTAVCRSMGAFRKSIVRAVIDAPIAEMLVVSLSVIDLSRWYAYLCILKAFEGVDLHLSATRHVRMDDIYWPNLAYLTVRTSQKDSEHLARVLDYGVRSNFVIDRRRIEELRVQFTDVDKWNQNLSRNLYHFRCWAGSAGFGERFRQQFAEPQHV